MDPVLLIILGVVLVALVGGLLLRPRWWGERKQPAYPFTSLAPMPLEPEAELRRLLAAGNKIEAIKLVRLQTGLGLKEAKEYVEALPNAPSLADLAAAQPAPRAVTNIEQEARQLVAAGNTIEAIRRVRELTGMGLKEAKEYVESLQ